MQPPKWQIVLALFVLLLAAVGVCFSVFVIAKKLATLDQPLIIAILAAAATVLTSTITVVIGRIFERKKEIEAHFRQTKFDQYDELLKILYELLDPARASDGGSSDEVIKRLRDWQRKLILFAGPKTIVAFVDWMRDLKNGNPTVKSFVLMDRFFKALRSDLGVSNRGLEEAIFAHLLLQNGDLVVSLAKTSPGMSIVEVAQLEELLKKSTSDDKSTS